MSDRIRKLLAGIRSNYPDNPYPGDLERVAHKMLTAFIDDMEEVREMQNAKLHTANRNTVPSKDWYYGGIDIIWGLTQEYKKILPEIGGDVDTNE